MNSLSPVPFHGQTLFVIPVNDQPFTPMKPIVEGMGMNWAAQHAKLKTNADRFCIANIAIQIPGDDQARETLCMPLRKLPGWLMTINPKKVAIGIRKTVILYQNECDDALWNFWTKGEAVNKRKAPALPAPRTRNTLDDYCALYKGLPESPRYWADLSMRFYNECDEFGKILKYYKKQALKPFRENRKSDVTTYFDEAMDPHCALFEVAEKQLNLVYTCFYEALEGLRNTWLLLRKG